MKFIFWLSVIWIVYTYIGYLLVLLIITAFRKTKIAAISEDYQPSVSIAIAAFNEEKSIDKKIKNCLELDYSKEKLEIIIVSDASSDRTDEIVSSYRSNGVKLLRMSERKGKTAAQNHAASLAKNEILVFSDATTIYRKDAIRKLVRNFEDLRVGCVGGEEHFIASHDGIASLAMLARNDEGAVPRNDDIVHEAGFFWKYERFLRQKESEFNTLIGVSGCIFAIRKELYELLEDSLIEDFALPLIVASKGYKVICEREAVAYEKAAANTKAELSRKTRIVTGGINVLYRMRHLLNPFRYPLLSFQLISHKVFRWLAPVFMLSAFISNMYLMNSNTFFFAIGLCQIVFYALAFAGHFIRNYRFTPKLIKIAYHFCIMNFAAFFGILQFLKGKRRVVWEPVR